MISELKLQFYRLVDVDILISADPVVCTMASINIYNRWGRQDCTANGIAVQNTTYMSIITCLEQGIYRRVFRPTLFAGPIGVHIGNHGMRRSEVNIPAQYNTYISIIIRVLHAIYLLVLTTGTPFVLIGIDNSIYGIRHSG
jgi:hypothetical protein